MPTQQSDGFTTPPKRWPLLAAGVGGTLIIVLAVVGVVSLLSGGESHKTAALVPPTAVLPPSTASPSPSASISPPAVPSSAPPTGPLILPSPTGNVQGVPVGYPATTAGAISAAYQYQIVIGSNLDPDRAAVIARVVAAPSFTTAQTDFASGATATRMDLGLPTTPSAGDEGVSLTVTPEDYQVSAVTSTNATVQLLSLLAVNDPRDQSKTKEAPVTTEVQMVRQGGDWRIASTVDLPAAERMRLTVDPSNSAAATSLGWIPIDA